MTISEWVAGLAALSITGVKRKYTAPPQQVNTGDLPAMYPRVPQDTVEVVSFGGTTGLTVASIELVIAICPYALSTAATEFARAVSLIDAMKTTLDAAVISLGIDRYTIRQDILDLGSDTVYWGLVATVEASF